MKRSAPAYTPLFRSELQLQLVALLTESEREWTFRELADSLDAAPASLHRELHRLLDVGLVVRRSVGRTQLYRAVTESPLHAPLRELLTKTVGVEAEIRRVLERFPEIQLALIHGSWARAKVGPTSDVDVLIVGDAPYRELRTQLYRLGKRLGRRIDPVVFGPAEFRERLAEGNSFIRGALDGPHVVLVGDADVAA
jgi:predicted nucleotidyltransferase